MSRKEEQKLDKKKLLFAITLGELGGAQKYVRDLSLGLKKKYDVTIAPGSEDQTLLRWADENDIRTISLPSLGRSLWKGFLPTRKDYKAFINLFRVFRDEDYDIVHLNSSKMGFLGAIAAKMAGVPRVVFTAHGWVFNEPEKIQSGKVRWLWILLSKVAGLFQDRIICVSNYDLDQAIKYRVAPPKKLLTIYNGLERKKVRFASRNRARKWLRDKLSSNNYQLSTDTKVIGTVANHYPAKDLPTMIKSLKHLPENHILVIIGDGPENKKLNIIAHNTKVKDRVFFLGRIEDGWQWIRSFDVYVISSLKEGMPYNVLEAMAAGVPIVSTSVGGLKEMLFPVESSEYKVSSLKKRAIEFPVGNYKRLAREIKKLLSDKELSQSIADNAEEALKSDFTFKKMREKTEWIYKF